MYIIASNITHHQLAVQYGAMDKMTRAKRRRRRRPEGGSPAWKPSLEAQSGRLLVLVASPSRLKPRLRRSKSGLPAWPLRGALAKQAPVGQCIDATGTAGCRQRRRSLESVKSERESSVLAGSCDPLPHIHLPSTGLYVFRLCGGGLVHQ